MRHTHIHTHTRITSPPIPPSLPHTQVDSKKELEKRLKAVCESFIMAATKVAVDPMLSFLTKVRACMRAPALLLTFHSRPWEGGLLWQLDLMRGRGASRPAPLPHLHATPI